MSWKIVTYLTVEVEGCEWAHYCENLENFCHKFMKFGKNNKNFVQQKSPKKKSQISMHGLSKWPKIYRAI
jgi:hypothetical protein